MTMRFKVRLAIASFAIAAALALYGWSVAVNHMAGRDVLAITTERAKPKRAPVVWLTVKNPFRLGATVDIDCGPGTWRRYSLPALRSVTVWLEGERCALSPQMGELR